MTSRGGTSQEVREGFFTSESASGLVQTCLCRARDKYVSRTYPLQWLIRHVDGRMIVLRDTACHAAAGDPANLTRCPRGAWEDHMLVETVLSMLTVVCHFKKVMHRVWAYFQVRLAFTMAAFNVLVQWYGLRPNAAGFVPLSMAEFSL